MKKSLSHTSTRVLVAITTLTITLLSPTQTKAQQYVSPKCQRYLTSGNLNQLLLDKDTQAEIDLCIQTGYFKDGELTIYENENPASSNPQEIDDLYIPKNATCTLETKCPDGYYTLKSSPNKKETIKGKCIIPKDSDTGSCRYTNNTTFAGSLKGIDFSAPSTPLQNSNQLTDKNLRHMLSKQEQLRLSLYMLQNKLAPTTKSVPLYFGAIDPETEFTCPENGKTYTFQETKKMIPTDIKRELNKPKPNWQNIFLRFNEDTKTKQEWTMAIGCMPLSPQQPTTSKPGIAYTSLSVPISTTNINIKSSAKPYPTDARYEILSEYMKTAFATPQDEIKRINDKLDKTSPLSKYYYDIKQKIKSKKEFIQEEFIRKGNRALNNMYDPKLYGLVLTNKTNSVPKPKSKPKYIREDDIQEADAILTLGFPANIFSLVINTVSNFAIGKIERHYLTIPPIHQQLTRIIKNPDIKKEIPKTEQAIIDKQIQKPIALKGSKISGGDEGVPITAQLTFSTYMPQQFPEYCDITTPIVDYLSGACKSDKQNDTSPTLACTSGNKSSGPTVPSTKYINKKDNSGAMKVIKNNPLSNKMVAVIEESAKKHGVPGCLIVAMMFAEGGFERTNIYGKWADLDPCTEIPNCTAGNVSNQSAMGPYQILTKGNKELEQKACNFVSATDEIAKRLSEGVAAIATIRNNPSTLDKYGDAKKFFSDVMSGSCQPYKYATKYTGTWTDSEVVNAARYIRGQCDAKYFSDVLYVYNSCKSAGY